MRMVNLPIAFLSSSIQDFFRQQVTDEFYSSGKCENSFWRFLALTIIGALILIVPLVLLMPWLFQLFFGPQWDQAGILVQAVSVLIIVRFISSPLSYIWIVRNQQKLDFLANRSFANNLFLPFIFLQSICLNQVLINIMDL